MALSKPSFAFAGILALAACTTTGSSGDLDALGYTATRSAGSAQLYQCQSSICAGTVLERGRGGMTPAEANQMRVLSAVAASGQNVSGVSDGLTPSGRTFLATNLTTSSIGGLSSLQGPITLAGRSGGVERGYMIRLFDNQRVEYFIAYNSNPNTARSEARRVATHWARTQ